MCRKPLDNKMGKRGEMKSKLSVVENVEKWDVGALNIDATRIEFVDEADKNVGGRNKGTTYENKMFQGDAYKFESNTKSVLSVANDLGRFPSNVIGEVEGHQKYFYNPKHEPIVMCRKPLDNKMGKRGEMKSKLNVSENVEKWGVGAINIDATRIESEDWTNHANKKNATGGEITDKWVKWTPEQELTSAEAVDYENKALLNTEGRFPSNVIGEIEAHQKYFYCPKVNKKERNIGVANNHPTIKPIALMLYLVKMITPPNGKVLDPFNGSGSTGMAVKEFGSEYVGIDLDENYIEISSKRILAWDNNLTTQG